MPKEVFPIDASLVFCYANPVVLAPIQEFEADYRTVELLKIPAGKSFEQAMKQKCTAFALPEELEHRLQSQTQAEERALWHSLPPAIQTRVDKQSAFDFSYQ